MSLFRNRNKTIEDRLRKQLGDLEYKPSDSLWDRIGGELKEDDFEQKIQSKTDEFEMIPYPETWGKIEAELPEERVSRPLFNRWGYAALLLLFITGVYAGFLLRNQGQPTVMVLNEKPSTPSLSNKPADDRKTVLTANATRSHSDKQKQIRINRITTSEHQQVQHSSVLVTNSSNTRVKQSSAKENYVVKTPSAGMTSLPVAINKTNSKSIAQKQPQAMNDQSIASPVVPADAESKKVIAEVVLPEKQNSPAQEITVIAPSANTQVQSGNTSMVSDSTKSVMAQSPAVVATLTPAPITGDISGEQLSRYSITAVAGIQYCFSRLAAPSSSNIDFSKNIALRKAIEKPSLDWSGLFMVDYMINNHWRVSAGIGMLNFSQQFYYNITAPSHPPSNSEPGASTINTNDSIISGNNYSTRIKYSWTEIPILVTYSFNHKNRFGLELQGGFSYAMISSVDAGMVSYDNIGVLVLKDKSAFPGIKNNFFVQFNPALTYQVNNQITLSVMPTFKYSLNSMIDNNNWVQQYPYFIGTSVSLRRRF